MNPKAETMKFQIRRSMIVLILILAFASVPHAQDYRKFKVGLGLGPVVNKAGAFITLEPAIRINDNLSVGFRMESAFLHPLWGWLFEDGVWRISSYSINGQYYIASNKKLRLFAGAGFGMYRLYDWSFVKRIEKPSGLGFYPRLGFDVGHFNVAVDFNILDSENIKSYTGIRIGAFIGGGRKKI